MKDISTLLRLAPCFLLLASVAACEEPTGRPSRAIASPLGSSSSEREVLGQPPAGSVGVPLLEIDTPNDKNDTMHIHTIGDTLRPASTRPASTSTAPASGPSGERTGTIDLTPKGTPPAPR